MQELQVYNNWNLTHFQENQRTTEVVHQEDFGVVNFNKWSNTYVTRFQPRATAIRRSVHDYDDTTREKDETINLEDDSFTLIPVKR